VLAHIRKDDEKAIELARQAADLDAGMDKHPATPAPVLPARELLADLLLEIGRPADALKEYETALNANPNRYRGFWGAACAAEKAGDRQKASAYYTKLVDLAAKADTERPEIRVAKAFLE